MKRDFIRLADLSLDEHLALFRRARELKQRRKAHQVEKTLEGRTLALVFEKPSTRTRLSFEAAIQQLGGSSITLAVGDSQLPRGETLADTARVMSRYVDCIMFRTFGDARLLEMSRHSSVPVINGLTDEAHPVQLLADLMTVEERLGKIAGVKAAFVGDGSSNMARSWMEAARIFGFELRIATPNAYPPPAEEVAAAKGAVRVGNQPRTAVDGVDVVVTDVWISMGQEKEVAARRAAFDGYCVDLSLMKAAKPGAFALHCLPAHRGEEIAAEVIDAPDSAIWDEAENRIHAQKALLEKLILG